ncbi:MAG: CaiB/BaiF CoA-transferase family protein [Clostridiales bacterium]|nr:CaiB/BaiF CoA-transferase family protein [Clostridiales bacterium]
MENQGALSNLRILDLTRVLAGPFCTMLLADMGADVIKIEQPGKGDDSRAYAPFKNGESLYYANVNRSKRSVTLNLKKPEGKELFLRMVKEADVVVENYRPGVMDKLGIGYDVLNAVNPRIIYVAISGFGSYGKYSQRPGYDIIAQAMGGVMSLTGWPSTGPTRSGNALGDVMGGMNGAIGVLAAVNARNITGKGQRVDISLVDGIVASLENALERYQVSGKLAERNGNRYNTLYPYDSFDAKDGTYVLGCGNQKLWEIFARECMHQEELIADPRFLTPALRNDNWAELRPYVQEWSKNYTVKEIVDLILATGVPAAPIYNMQDLLDDEHICKDREMFVNVKHDVIGDMTVIGDAVKLMGTKNGVRWAAPSLGQHSFEVYNGIFGLSREELEQLQADGVI